MDKLEIKYRTWYKGIPPRPIKLQIPGWAGEPNKHTDGDKPQPWHCPPFVDGSTYGLELLYPFDTECHVRIEDGKVKFIGDFSEEQKGCPETPLPPFMSFAPGHFGMTSSLDIKVPSGYVLRLEPHPRYYTDTAYTAPCCVPGHIQTEWWSKIFFVVFKNPIPGQTIVFRKGEPYGQALVVPKKINYDLKPMTIAEAEDRNAQDHKVSKYCKNFVNNDWHDHLGHNFDDKYKVMSAVFAKGGIEELRKFIDLEGKKAEEKKKFRGKLVMRKKNEGVQNKEKKS
jgi:hypothetical protein